MMNTRFAYKMQHHAPLPAGRGVDPNPIRHCLRTQSDIPRSHVDIPSTARRRSPHSTARERPRRPVIDRESLDRERARTHERPSAATRPRERRPHARSRIRTRHVDARHGAMLPVVLLPRGRHAEAEAEDVGDRFVVPARARTRTRARARGEVVLFHPDARDRVGESSRAQFRYVHGGGASEVSHGYLYFAQR